MTTPRDLVRAGLLAAAALACAATSAPVTPPEPDVCANPPAGAAIDAIELGTGDGGAFAALHDGDAADVIQGGQGSDMLPVRLRVHGAAAPACLAQSTEIRQGADVLASETRPIATTDAGDGTRTTEPIYLVMGGLAPTPGGTITVTTTAGGQSATVTLQVR
jgi:hypothetical protein